MTSISSSGPPGLLCRFQQGGGGESFLLLATTPLPALDSVLLSLTKSFPSHFRFKQPELWETDLLLGDTPFGPLLRKLWVPLLALGWRTHTSSCPPVAPTAGRSPFRADLPPGSFHKLLPIRSPNLKLKRSLWHKMHFSSLFELQEEQVFGLAVQCLMSQDLGSNPSSIPESVSKWRM